MVILVNFNMKYDSKIISLPHLKSTYDKNCYDLCSREQMLTITFLDEVMAILTPFNIKVEYVISHNNELTIECFHEKLYIYLLDILMYNHKHRLILLKEYY